MASYQNHTQRSEDQKSGIASQRSQASDHRSGIRNDPGPPPGTRADTGPDRQSSCSKPKLRLSLAWWSWRGANTRSHPELGRENPQRRWYCVLRRGRVGRRQACKSRNTRHTHVIHSSAHTPAHSSEHTNFFLFAMTPAAPAALPQQDRNPRRTIAPQSRGVEQPGSSSGS